MEPPSGEDDDTHGGSGGSFDDDDASTLWGWLSRLVDNLKSIWEALSSIPGTLINGITSLFDNLKLFLSEVFTDFAMRISGLFQTLLDRIQEIFVPNVEEMDAQFSDFRQTLTDKFNLHFSAIESLKNLGSKPVEDVESSYDFGGYVGTLNVKMFDANPLVQALSTFRPIIRGFIIFCLLLFNINQVLSFIGQHSGIGRELRNHGGDDE